METASGNAAQACAWIPDGATVLVVCGNGNNGGDGYVLARLLHRRCAVTIAAVPDVARMSTATHANFLAATSLGIPVIQPGGHTLPTPDVVIDAIIGVGGGSDLRDPVPEWTRWVNSLTTTVVAIDVPTGLDSLTGEAHPDAIRATRTITMVGYKPGMLMPNGRRLCGEITVVGIGAPGELVSLHASAWAIEASDVRGWLPPRDPGVHKYRLGHVVVIAGSAGMRGAAALASEAALRIGAGVCTLVTDHVHPLLPREVMTAPLSHAHQVAERASVLIMGPGFGADPSRLQILVDVLQHFPDTPTVLDADGLRILHRLQSPLPKLVITPHPGEFQRVVEQMALPVDAATVARSLGCVVHLKSVPPVTTDGETTWLCTSGNAALATAGTGDVLSGMIGGLLAQGIQPAKAAALGAYIHGRCADEFVRKHAQETLLAGDLIRELSTVLAD